MTENKSFEEIIEEKIIAKGLPHPRVTKEYIDALFARIEFVFRRDAENGILLLCSDTMRKNYERYADLLCFDITYKLLKKKKKQVKHLGVGFFVGQDENTRITLFAMCTIAT